MAVTLTAGLGFDPDAVRTGIREQEIKDRLRHATEDATEGSVFGSTLIQIDDEFLAFERFARVHQLGSRCLLDRRHDSSLDRAPQAGSYNQSYVKWRPTESFFYLLNPEFKCRITRLAAYEELLKKAALTDVSYSRFRLETAIGPDQQLDIDICYVMGWLNEPGTPEEATELGLPYLTSNLTEVGDITQKSVQGWKIEIDQEPCDTRIIEPERDEDDMSVALSRWLPAHGEAAGQHRDCVDTCGYCGSLQRLRWANCIARFQQVAMLHHRRACPRV